MRTASLYPSADQEDRKHNPIDSSAGRINKTAEKRQF